jgi:hypothetical protein
MSDRTSDWLRNNIWHLGGLAVAIVTAWVKLSALEAKFDRIEPVRDRTQALESLSVFHDRRLSAVEVDAKQSAILIGEFRSKLDVMGHQVANIAEWVKDQKRKEP